MTNLPEHVFEQAIIQTVVWENPAFVMYDEHGGGYDVLDWVDADVLDVIVCWFDTYGNQHEVTDENRNNLLVLSRLPIGVG